MSTHTQLEKYNAPHTYVERLGVDAESLLRKLSEPPERPLSDEESQKFLTIDYAIAEGRYTSVIEVEGEKIEKVLTAEVDVHGWYKSSVPTPADFILDYFLTHEGGEALRTLEADLGISPGEEREQSLVHIARRLARCTDATQGQREQVERLKGVAKESHVARVEELKRRWSQGEPIDDDPEHVKLQARPEKVIERIEAVLAMRRFLREVRADLRKRIDMTDATRDALLVEVDVFRQRATEILGGLYPQFVDIYKQAMLTEDIDHSSQLLKSLEEVNRPLYNVSEDLLAMEQEESDEETVSNSHHDFHLRFAFTMDKWRNGYTKGVENSPFSSELISLAWVLEAEESQPSPEELPAVFSHEEIDYLASLEFKADDIAAMCRHFLSRNNLLSQHGSRDYVHGEWPLDSSTEHPKIGIVIGEFDNISYDRGWVRIPKSTKRKVNQTTPAGAALVVPHELEHAIDGISSEYGSSQVASAKAGTRLSEGVRESIGKRAENDASEYLFGKSLTPSLAYLKALQSLLTDQGETQAIMRFAEQVAEQEGNHDVSGYIRNAENRVQRLINFGGLNSKSLVYLEQELVKRSLSKFPEKVNKIVATNSYLDLRTQVRLHEFGLLAEDRYQPHVSPIHAVEEYLRNILSQRKTS